MPAGNQPVTIRRRAGFELTTLEAALADLIRRHEILRTRFCTEQDGPVAMVGDPGPIAVPMSDLSGHPLAEQEARRLAAVDATVPFDLAHAPLIRSRMVRLAPGDDRLYLTIHRAAADLAALHRGLLHELAALYEARAAGRTEPPAPLQHLEIVRQQQAWLQTPEGAGQLEYWRRRLAGPPPALELSADRARPPVRTFRGARHAVTIDAALTASARAVARQADVEAGVVVLAALASLLRRHTEEDDAVVGVLADGRTSPTSRLALGCLANPLALRLDLGGDPSFRVLLARVRASAQEAGEHAVVPFAHVVRAVQARRDPARAPLFATLFVFEPHDPAPPDGWALAAYETDPGTADVDLQLELVERSDTLEGVLIYRTDLFEPATIAALGTQLVRLLAAALADPDRAMSRLPWLDAHEHHQVVVAWNRTARPYPDEATVHALVERQTARAPDRIAIVAGGATLSYGELDRRASALAARLQGSGVGRGAVVGVAIDRSPETIVAYLGILKAGAAYLPLGLADPPERLAFMVADAGVSAVLTHGPSTRMPVPGVPLLEVDGEAAPDAAGPRRAPATPDDLVYVMYTSGSTGHPKGVAIAHRGITRLLFGQDGYTRLDRDEVILQATALGFDVAAFEIWGALVHGGRLVLYPAAIPTARELREVIRRHGVTTMWLTPSVFNMVLDEDPECLAPLRQLDLGGEALSVPHVARAAAVLPQTRLINGYGPTECSVSATGYVVPRPVDPAAASIPIGRPIGNTTAYVLDRHLRPVPIGVPGELCLGGPGLAQGYVNRPEETRARFVPHPFDPTPGARVYRTGDRARWRPDGTLEYLGRLDAQVKIRGVRIEPGEIEAVLSRHPGVREAAVMVRDDPAGKRLVACVVARPGVPFGPEELRDHVRRVLPASMVPATVVQLAALPLTPSGKIDRRALAAVPDAPERERRAPPAPPAGSLEAQLVELWETVLGVSPIGVEDDFFELGGDSLRASRMIQQVGDLTGCALPLTTLHQSPTVTGLARVLRGQGERAFDATAPAITFNRAGDRPPLFLFHGMLTGGAFYALRLARRLGPRQPIHVVHPFTGVTAPIPSTIEAMAEAHLKVVRSLQPHGPYRLAGYCNGGLAAYEIARRLRRGGETVELLALVAAAPVTPLARTGRLLRRLAGLAGLPPERAVEPVARLRSFVDAFAELPLRRRPAFVVAKTVALARRLARRGLGRPPGFTPDIMDRYHRVVMRYFPSSYPGAVVLLWPEHEPWGTAAAAAAAWRRLVPSVSVHVVPGDHLAVVHEHLDVLAGYLLRYLDGTATPVAPAPSPAWRPVHLGASVALLDAAKVFQHVSELTVCLR
jgi:amino acid adenylation domain-containing protein